MNFPAGAEEVTPVLVVVQHDGTGILRASLGAVTLARRLGFPFAFVVLGSGLPAAADSLKRFGAARIFVADDALLAEPLADRYAYVIADAATRAGAHTVLGISSTFTKDILPRVAALLDAPMVSDITAVECRDGDYYFDRFANAGNLSTTVRLEGPKRVVTARGAMFPTPTPINSDSPIEAIVIDASKLPAGTRFISREQTVSARPDLNEARIVVTGGRPLRDKETFERLIGGLADVLGGAVGATRAAVDAGMAPNHCQVGQTAKSVSPELYIAVGVSGAIQHVAGITDSRVIIAINRDPEAPIFQVATYGLVGDLHEIVPRLIQGLRC